MERRKVEAEVKKPVATNRDVKWRKLGAGSFKLRNRYIKQNEVFFATPEEIPPAFRNTIIQLGGVPEDKPILRSKPVKSVYSILPRGKSKSQFDIVNEDGKRFNETLLTKVQAESFLNDLNK